MACQLAIIADDLTGACDTALQFARAGLRAEIVLGDHLPGSSDCDVLAFDSDSRDCSAEQAYEHVTRTIMRAAAYRPATFYKKVDSTLRGNVGRELDALLDACQAEAVLLAPAFPALGRTVENGLLLFQGRRLTETPFAAALPVASAAVAEIVSSTAQNATGTISLAQLRAGPAAIAHIVYHALTEGKRIIVADTASDNDLAVLAATLSEHPTWLAAGSAGLAAAIAALLPHNQPNAQAGARSSPSAIQQPVLTVVGSAHPVALEQRQVLATTTGQIVVTLEPAALEHQRSQTIALIADQLHSLLKKNTSAILTTAAVDRRADHTLDRALAGALGEIAARVAPYTGAMILTGGDTAAATFQQLQAQAITVIREVRPGMPLLAVRGGTRPGLAVITKSGGFGGPEYLRDAYNGLRMASDELCHPER